MNTYALSPIEEQLSEIRDLSLQAITIAPAFLPPSEAASHAANYVHLSHVLEYHRADPDMRPEALAPMIASTDQALAALKARIAELEALQEASRS